MSSRTYIGPFGRILPLADGAEPEPLPRPLDEERSGVQLPQPALNFGSDTQLGVTDPTRYNTGGTATTSRDKRHQHGERSRHLSYEQLPPVTQLLTPGTQPSMPASPYSSQQQSPGSSQGRSSFASSHQGPVSEQTYPSSHSAYHQSPHTGLGFHAPDLSRAGNYNPSIPTQQSPSYLPTQQIATGYGSYTGVPMPLAYQGQPNLSTPRYPGYHPEQGHTMNPSRQYYPDAPSAYNFVGNPGPSSAHGQQSPPNTAKPAPRLMREDVIPGEGPVWVYEDGTTCPKVIDGEPVNAEWGVTKAGKPRKRLAIACTSCRDKKIKCEPAEPKCVQCEKLGRECKFTTAPRTQRIKSESPSYDSQARLEHITIKTETPHVLIAPSPRRWRETIGINGNESLQSKEPITQPESLEHKVKLIRPNSSVKRRRSLSRDVCVEGKKGSISYRRLSPRLLMARGRTQLPKHDCVEQAHDIDPESINHYMDMYFRHVNNATAGNLHQGNFMHWFNNTKAKSSGDLILVYAILAVGTLYSTRIERITDGNLFCNIARDAMHDSQGRSLSQMSQARTLIALYHLSCGQQKEAWALAASGLPAAFHASLESIEPDSERRYRDPGQRARSNNAN